MAGFSKRQFALAALTELGVATRGYQLTTDEAQDAGVRLDAMMAMWDARGIHLGYPITADPSQTNLDTATSVPAWANEAVINNLAIRLGPMYGRPVSPETKTTAKDALNAVRGRSRNPPPAMRLPAEMPAGAGNAPWLGTRGVFLRRQDDPLDLASESELDFD